MSTYALTEIRGPPGYTLTASNASIGVATGPDRRSHSQPADAATCYFVNNDQPAPLTLVKTVTNDNGGTAVADRLDARRRRTHTDLRDTGVDSGDQRGRERRHLRAVGVRRPGRLHRRRWSCTGGTLTGTQPSSVANGANAICTINNNDQPAQLTLVKTVTNDNGGTACRPPGP